MKEALSHILDQSVCLTRRQMKDYLAGSMLTEEQHAAEVHLASCPLCRMSMEGFEMHSEEALAAIATLNAGFLKEHYDAVTPRIHLNSVAPAMSAPRQRKAAAIPLWKSAAMAAGLVLAAGLFWYLNEHKSMPASSRIIADNTLTAEPSQPSFAPQSLKANDAESISARHVKREVKAVHKNGKESTPLKSGAVATKKEDGNGSIAQPGLASPSTSADAKSTWASEATADDASGAGIAEPHEVRNSAPAMPGKPLSKPAAAVRAKGYAAPAVLAKKEADKEKSGTAASADRRVLQEASAAGGEHGRTGIQAARAYVAAGQKVKAITVLKSVIAAGGPDKRAAKKLLRQLQKQDGK